MGAAIKLLCLHATVGTYASSINWLTIPASKVSCHYLIRKDGHIAQLVADDQAAWHAGVSQWFDMDSAEILRGSIGIEIENLYGMKLPNGKYHGSDPYPPAQLTALRELCVSLVGRYSILPDMFVRHLDIATPRGRKSDPAYFPWSAFKASVYASPPAPDPPKAYKILGTPVYQDRECRGAIAVYLPHGSIAFVDVVYPEGVGHLVTGAGFIKLDASVEAF